MATGANVLTMLIPTGGWVISADDFDSIRYDEGVAPITKKQFDDGFSQFDKWKIEQDKIKTEAKSNLLSKLGITEDEAKLLLG